MAAENLEGEPVDMGLFGSVYDPNAKHGLTYKLATKLIIKKQLDKEGIDTSKRIDFGNWDQIREWARGLADMLK